MQSENVNEVPELSLMEGGPGDALMKRLRIIRPEFGAASARTAIILAALAWVPCSPSPLSRDWLWAAREFRFYMIWPRMFVFWLRCRSLCLPKFLSEGV